MRKILEKIHYLQYRHLKLPNMQLIEREDALAIFCYVIYVYENTNNITHGAKSLKNEKFASKKFIEAAYKNCKKAQYKFGIPAAINKRIYSKKIEKHLGKKTFYDFYLQVNNSKCIEISKPEQEAYEEYIYSYTDSIVSERAKAQLKENLSVKVKVAKNNLIENIFQFQNSYWWVNARDFNIQTETRGTANIQAYIHGINRSLLELGPFGQARMYFRRPKSEEEEKPQQPENKRKPGKKNKDEEIKVQEQDKLQVYYGSYSIYQNEYLRLRFSFHETETPAVKMSFYIGDESLQIPEELKNKKTIPLRDLYVGLFNSINKNIFAGTVILDKIEKTINSDEDLQSLLNNVQFFRLGPNFKMPDHLVALNANIEDFIRQAGNLINIPLKKVKNKFLKDISREIKAFQFEIGTNKTLESLAQFKSVENETVAKAKKGPKKNAKSKRNKSGNNNTK